MKRIGSQKHFQANASAPVFDSLRDLVLKTSGVADVLRTALAAFGAEIRARDKQAFLMRVLAQPGIWIVGRDRVLDAAAVVVTVVT